MSLVRLHRMLPAGGDDIAAVPITDRTVATKRRLAR